MTTDHTREPEPHAAGPAQPAGPVGPAPAGAPWQPDYPQLFEQAAVGLLEVTFEGRVALLNPYCARLLGWSSEALRGRSVAEITHPEDIPATLAAFECVVRGDAPMAVLEKRYLRPDGSVVWSRSRLSLLRDAQGLARSLVAVVADITELKQAQLALREVNAHLQAALEGGLHSLGVALEARDLETSGHTQRVVKLSLDLAFALGLERTQMNALRQGAYLHDIGKLCIPDAVLLKPGRLDAAEWALMQTHASRGHEIASRIPALPDVALQVIRHHHERWDGTGYPDRLAGEEICMPARIFAVCDVYDALTSERPYKRAWSEEEALTELRCQRGRQFDPAVVDAFTAILSEDRALLRYGL